MAQEEDDEVVRLGTALVYFTGQLASAESALSLRTATHDPKIRGDIGAVEAALCRRWVKWWGRILDRTLNRLDITFNVEEVQKIVRDNIELCLGGNTYSHSRAPQWVTVITEKTIARLNKLNKPFKYIMRMTVTQKNGSGLHTAAAYYWDTATDGTCTVRWENKFMYCIVNIWALALQI